MMGKNFSKTQRIFLLLLYCLLCDAGDEMVKLQELEGTTITLHTGITGIQTDSRIQWLYGPEKGEEEEILFSHVFEGKTFTETIERFKERLQLNRSTGDLTIRNINRNDSGVYLLKVLTGRLLEKTFSVRVYAPVSAPVINPTGVLSPVLCVLQCSVHNGEDLTLSWYRESERISTTNNTELGADLNLPLQLNLTQNHSNTYSCVSHNPVSWKTTPLNPTQHCPYSAGVRVRTRLLSLAVISSGVSALLIIILSVILFIKQKRKAQHVSGQPEQLTYAVVTIPDIKEDETCRTPHAGDDREPVVYSDVNTCR